MIKIGICDDDYITCSELEKRIYCWSKKAGVEVCVVFWYTGEKIKKYLQEGNTVDLLFLDIELVQCNGVSVGTFVRDELDNQWLQIVYISAKAHYAMQLFHIRPMDFLIKPVGEQELERVLNQFLKLLKREPVNFEYTLHYDLHSIPLKSICYFESQGKKVLIRTKEETLSFYGKLKEVMTKVGGKFILIHQSFLVNTDYIACYSYETVEMWDGQVLSISKANRKRVRQELFQKIGGV